MGGGENARDKSAAAAEAAQRREKLNTQNLSVQAAEALKERQKKDDLLGKIAHLYREAGREEPFGLASCTMEQLVKHYKYAQTFRGENSLSKQ